MPGSDGATLIGTLRDGSAVGQSFVLIPPSNPIFQLLQVSTLVRWVGEVASEIAIADSNDPTAQLNLATGLGLSAKGDIVGERRLNGVVSAFRYNVFDQSFGVIELNEANVFQFVALGVNDAGNILAAVNGQPRLFDPGTNSWTTVPIPSGFGFTGFGFLNSAGEVAMTLVDFSTFRSWPYVLRPQST